ncbi:tRNA (N(6)-L-threonylcarbamoyladenosine(37)-C(2))-methylthiotransferase MtaB [bacterium]|nr:tRNA (N(6)-L-threonylcarbamoyladenosine(37)-C(2))-methylthiotransferase MtaB [bacterium]
MRIAFKTFGCKANSLDTDALLREAALRGHEVVEEGAPADAFVINSCTVTHAADRDARLSALKFKRHNPEGLVGVVGCYGQVGKEELLDVESVDVVLGTANKHRVFEHFEQARTEQAPARDQVETTTGYLPAEFPGSRNARASIKIQDGCNFKCSFCIIPQARGRSRSLGLEAVEAQVASAYAQGFQEVVLTGIHLAHYGWDLGTDLLSLLKRLLATEEGPRIRLSTLDPFEIPDELVAMLARERRLCPHFHIALQSGSDEVLKGMRRIYKAAEFTEVTRKIQAVAPHTFIGVDVIVGFPGETQEEFEKTVSILENTFWSKLHVFPFSVRRGTRAETLPGAVPDAVKAERSKRLRDLSDQRLQAFLQAQVGTLQQVILEKPSRTAGFWQGHTANYCATLSQPGDHGEKQAVLSKVVGVQGERLVTQPLH